MVATIILLDKKGLKAIELEILRIVVEHDRNKFKTKSAFSDYFFGSAKKRLIITTVVNVN
jgi:hypothetical protein